MNNEAPKKKTKSLKLIITIKGGRDRIYIGKDVVRALGMPPYVCIKINEDMSALAIQPGEEKEYMSFKVPDKLFANHKVDFTVHSKRFVYELLSSNGLDTTINHPLHGIVSPKGNAVIFKIKPDSSDGSLNL